MKYIKIKKSTALLSISIITLCALAYLQSQAENQPQTLQDVINQQGGQQRPGLLLDARPLGEHIPASPVLLINPGQDEPQMQRGATIQPETQFKDPQAVNQIAAQSCVLDFAAFHSEDIQRFEDINNIYNYAVTIAQLIQGGPYPLPQNIRENIDVVLRNQNIQQNAGRNCVTFKEKIKATAEIMFVISNAIYWAIPPNERGSAGYTQSSRRV